MDKKDFKLIETKGQVKFYEDLNGEQYQELLDFDTTLKVIDGDMKYKIVLSSKLHPIVVKYNLNGVYGYSIWKDDKCLEDRFWSVKEALESAKDLGLTKEF